MGTATSSITMPMIANETSTQAPTPPASSTAACRSHAQLESDIVTFTHGKPQSSGRKQKESAVTSDMLHQLRGTLAGQDYVLVVHPEAKDVRQTICILCDGHGEYGELFSVAAGEYLAKAAEEEWGELKRLCYATGGFMANGGGNRMQRLFARTESYLRQELGSNCSGGTT